MSEDTSGDTRTKVRLLNDVFRASLITQKPLGKLYATDGIAAHGADFQIRAIEAIIAKTKPEEARKLLEPLRTARAPISTPAIEVLGGLPAAQITGTPKK